MARVRPIGLVIVGTLVLSGCFAWSDFGIEWRDGPYALTWVDRFGTMSLSYETGNDSWGTLVGEAVFAVGADKRYIVAKQHPAEDKTITNYFIVDRGQKPFARDSTAVTGPFTEKEFGRKVTELKLPGFSKTIDILN